MTQTINYPDWKEIVTYSDKGPKPYVLVETETYKSVIIGLQPGTKLPPHTEGPAIFHFLEGVGQVTVGDDNFTVQAGSTVIVPDGAIRGIEATTQLALIAVRLPA